MSAIDWTQAPEGAVSHWTNVIWAIWVFGDGGRKIAPTFGLPPGTITLRPDPAMAAELAAARAEAVELKSGPWFLLFGGESVDGMGPGQFIGRTTDRRAALEHHLNCRLNPYSVGYVVRVDSGTHARCIAESEVMK